MNWLKEVVVDVIITLVLICIFLFNRTEWVLAFQIYTPILLFLKLIAILGSSLGNRLHGNAPPTFFHTLYAINVLVFLINGWWALCVQWMIVWFLSSIFNIKIQKSAALVRQGLSPHMKKLAHRR
jgi:hypothetical protein